ncbi:predicted protein [Streptomyces lividans TK24]|uniref:Uncharacterized protein n=1 Tax=Streptomyces lividans 1326 TaxID=1200984 RepID=A0A7U9DY06_STRLI|nr:predicted protein [Streptomyces lividans TK24]EOY49178.1 hypothetical protein SLI_4469 [Streptomyces lividans 1326]
MPDDILAVAGRCGMFVPGRGFRHPDVRMPMILVRSSREVSPGPGVPGPGCWLDQGHGRVRSRHRARHGEAIPN